MSNILMSETVEKLLLFLVFGESMHSIRAVSVFCCGPVLLKLLTLLVYIMCDRPSVIHFPFLIIKQLSTLFPYS